MAAIIPAVFTWRELLKIQAAMILVGLTTGLLLPFPLSIVVTLLIAFTVGTAMAHVGHERRDARAREEGEGRST